METQRKLLLIFGSTICLAGAHVCAAQGTMSATLDQPVLPVPPISYLATQILGLPDAKANVKGEIIIAQNALVFQSADLRVELPYSRILGISIGDERVEKGGTLGMIGRKAIPYGGGLALALASQKSVDLLTVEFRDERDGYHGAVFVVPTQSAKALSDLVLPKVERLPPTAPLACSNVRQDEGSVMLELIAVSDVDLPSEYRVLLFERLFTELHKDSPSIRYIRAGDRDAGTGCAAMTLKVTVSKFKKGNQAVRAATGPLSLFLGKTSITFNVQLMSNDRRTLMAADVTANKRSDSESLGIAKNIAKNI